MDKRAEYVETLSAQMVAWDVQIDQLKYKADNAVYGTNGDYTRAIAVLQGKRDEAALKLQGISDASDDEWEDLKSGTERVWGEVRSMLHDAIIKIS
jgi:hypothetical protein